MASHLQRLGHDVTLHANEVDAGLAASLAWVKIADGLHELPAEADGILVQDAICALQLAERLPGVPQLFLAHSTVHDVQLPPQVAGVCAAAVAFNERVAGRLRAQALPLPLHRLTQPVDLDVFAPRVAVRERALKVLVVRQLPAAGAARDARRGLRGARARARRPRRAHGALGRPRGADARRRHRRGLRPLHRRGDGVRPRRVRLGPHGRRRLGDGRVLPRRSRPTASAAARPAPASTPRGCAADLAAYDPAMGVVNRDIAIREHGPRQHAQALVGLLRAAGARAGGLPPLAELARLARVAWDLERRAIGLSRRVEGEVAARREEVAAHRARSDALAEELRQAARRGRRRGGGGRRGAGAGRRRRAGAHRRTGERRRAQVDAPLPHGRGARPPAGPRARGRAPRRRARRPTPRRTSPATQPGPARPPRASPSSPSSSSPTAPSRRSSARSGPCSRSTPRSSCWS